MAGRKPAILHSSGICRQNYWMLNGKYFALIMS
ncbi:hypothetical protein Rleg2_4486 (plasmid) [Rhizobium leguminosarum bv. trifolii WSM2304]|uniref:Uncharacterized protein n=1 Tax=Rhizobium leguminosarum bv. trifolii (strain WSM2304) TaxID=395492 RepID=A0ABF7QU99_RHILW|nr:hypothetical protein Rleg2_4486 [Rhizobium leguminosarum bv. trifolii WSM2304]